MDANTILNSIDAAAYAKDLDGNYTYANALVQRIFGADLAGIIGKDDSHFFDLEQYNALKLNDAEVMTSGRAVERASRRPARACALAVAAALVLAGCEADPIAARATLTELGFHGIALSRAPLTGRPCAWGEPFAVRYRAVTEDGRIVNGILCSADEATEDVLMFASVH